MGESNEKLLKAIRHYQESLDRHSSGGNSEKLLHALQKLSRLPIKMCHLEETGVGRTVNSLKKVGGDVGNSARVLVDRWKEMVKGEQSADSIEEDDVEAEGDSKDSDVDETQTERLKSERDSDSESDDAERLNGSREKRTDSDSKGKHASRSDNDRKGKSKRRRDSSAESSGSKSKPVKHKKPGGGQTSREDEKSKGKSHHDNRKKGGESKSSSPDKSAHKKSSAGSSREDKYKISENERSKSSKSEDSRKSSGKHSEKRRRADSSSSSSDERSKHKHRTGKKTNEGEKKKEERRKDDDGGKHSKKSDKDTKGAKSAPGSSKPQLKNPEAKKHTERSKINRSSIKNGIDSESGASFAEALGMLEPPRASGGKRRSGGETLSVKSTKKSKSAKIAPETKPEDSDSDDENAGIPELLKGKRLEPLDINVSSLLPPPNYKPLGAPVEHPSRLTFNEEDALNKVISMKNKRTKIYSGNKSAWAKVPTLFDLCSRILQDNLDALEYTGGVPYSILKHILEKANPDQLYMLEHHNPYLIDDTDELWHLHCQKEFRNKQREEMESWREMYMRCLDEREAKLKALTANIKQSQDKSLPVRTTKLAYVDDVAKPPRNIARKQLKNGTASGDKTPSPAIKRNQLAIAGEAGKIAVPNPASRAVERGNHGGSSSLKPKKAPLMAKMLSMLKGGRFGRR